MNEKHFHIRSSVCSRKIGCAGHTCVDLSRPCVVGYLYRRQYQGNNTFFVRSAHPLSSTTRTCHEPVTTGRARPTRGISCWQTPHLSLAQGAGLAALPGG